MRINSGEFSGLLGSELNTLRTSFLNLTEILMDEMSMTGRNLFINFDNRLRDVMGTTKPVDGLHIITSRDFFQLVLVNDAYIFKADDSCYGPLATNLWTKYFKMYSLTEIMRQKGEKEFCELLNRLRMGELTERDNKLMTQEQSPGQLQNIITM